MEYKFKYKHKMFFLNFWPEPTCPAPPLTKQRSAKCTWQFTQSEGQASPLSNLTNHQKEGTRKKTPIIKKKEEEKKITITIHSSRIASHILTSTAIIRACACAFPLSIETMKGVQQIWEKILWFFLSSKNIHQIHQKCLLTFPQPSTEPPTPIIVKPIRAVCALPLWKSIELRKHCKNSSNLRGGQDFETVVAFPSLDV